MMSAPAVDPTQSVPKVNTSFTILYACSAIFKLGKRCKRKNFKLGYNGLILITMQFLSMLFRTVPKLHQFSNLSSATYTGMLSLA